MAHTDIHSASSLRVNLTNTEPFCAVDYEGWSGCCTGYPAFRRISVCRTSFREMSFRRLTAPIPFVSGYPIRRNDIRPTYVNSIKKSTIRSSFYFCFNNDNSNQRK